MPGLDRVHERVADHFFRSEPRVRMREYVSGLAVGLERKIGFLKKAAFGRGATVVLRYRLGAQKTVMSADASVRRHALIDRELYLPESGPVYWTRAADPATDECLFGLRTRRHQRCRSDL